MRLIAALTLVALVAVGPAIAGDPPRPNLEKPVDYIKWYNDEFGKGLRENAADLYREAVADFEVDEETSDLLAAGADGTWTEEQVEPLRELINEHEENLRKLAEGARLSDCHFHLESESGVAFEIELPEFRLLRALARLAATRARFRFAEGRIDEGMDDVCAMLGLAEHLRQQPLVISYLFGLACSATAYDVLYDLPLVATGLVDYEKQVLSKLNAVDRAPRSPTKQISGERACAFDFAQRFLRDMDSDGRIDYLAAPNIPGMSNQSVPVAPPQRFDEIIKEVDAMYTRIGKLYDGDYAVARKRADTLERDLAAKKGTIVGILVPGLTEVMRLYYRVRTERNACRVMFHLHAWHAEHGRWPETLAEALSKRVLRRFSDPFSDKPFGYRLQDGKPVVYSVSLDGVDNDGDAGGKDKPDWHDAPDYVFWPRPKPSTIPQPASQPGE